MPASLVQICKRFPILFDAGRVPQRFGHKFRLSQAAIRLASFAAKRLVQTVLVFVPGLWQLGTPGAAHLLPNQTHVFVRQGVIQGRNRQVILQMAFQFEQINVPKQLGMDPAADNIGDYQGYQILVT